ncbi:MAG: peptidoglycan DD-metalloendopeptidase family protein [Planctomycetota bacterium]|jgi:murein DD-endopeptidase MepM/ murein hydrolase activator NlpD
MRRIVPLLLLAALAQAEWGRDINAGMGPQLLRSVEPDLVAIVKAKPADRAGPIEACIAAHGFERIEALKRYRNPELKELFFALLDHPEWQVKHRALFALEYYGDTAVIEKAWPFLAHPQRRLREKAAITLIKLWDGRPALDDLEGLKKREQDLHVRRCLEALQLRVEGKLKPKKVYDEVVRKRKNGLLLTPFVSGLKEKQTPRARSGGGRPQKAERWTTPVLGDIGDEEVSGVSLQPFANLRQNGTVHHTGLDLGACLDGGGFYSAAAGVVRLIHTGSDMGTMIVVQHQLPGGEKVNAVYMHGGDTVFVKAGDEVEAGQLLTTMGMSFSIENGGHFAHLHYGMYPGPFDLKHNYGYKPVKAGLNDWYDPKLFLKRWIERTQPLIGTVRPLDRELKGASHHLKRGDYSRARADALRVRNAAEPGSERHVDAVYLLGLIEQVPENAVDRARKIKDGGYPRAAIKELKAITPKCKGLRDADMLKKTLAEWEADPLLKKAMKGEGRIEATIKRAEKLDQAKARALWRKLLDQYGDTCLKPRIEERLR